MENGLELDEDTCASAAAGGGQLVTLQWLRGYGCPWDEETTAAAAHYGNVDILQWAIDNGCRTDERVYDEEAIIAHMDELQFHVFDEGRPWNQTSYLLAAELGQLAIIIWARSHGCPIDEEICNRAAMKNHVDILNWTWNHGCRCSHH
jgi:hypothetical protein